MEGRKEDPEENNTIRSFCQEAKGLTQKYITSLVLAARLKNAEQVTEQLVLLLEGAITMAQVNNSCAVRAKKAASVLIKNSPIHTEVLPA